jgi:restriction system protein
MARRGYYRRNAQRGYQRNARRRTSGRDEGIGGLLFFGALFTWYLLGHAWAIGLLLFFAATAVTVLIVLKRRKGNRLLASGIADIDLMDGRQFEERLAAHFRQQGYAVDLTPYRGDFGADLIIEHDGFRTAIQAKRWKGAVGVGAVQEIVSARAYYGCQQAMVVTNSSFTQAARQLATANSVTLWDRGGLIHELSAIPVARSLTPDRQLQW